MISDNELYSLAVFLGGLAMLLIVFYHFLEINSDEANSANKTLDAARAPDTSKGSSAKAQTGSKKAGR